MPSSKNEGLVAARTCQVQHSRAGTPMRTEAKPDKETAQGNSSRGYVPLVSGLEVFGLVREPLDFIFVLFVRPRFRSPLAPIRFPYCGIQYIQFFELVLPLLKQGHLIVSGAFSVPIAVG